MNTLQQLLARCENVMDAVKTLWERLVDAVGTLWGRCVHAVTGKFDMFRLISRRSHRTLYKRCGNAVWCDRGFMYVTTIKHVLLHCLFIHIIVGFTLI